MRKRTNRINREVKEGLASKGPQTEATHQEAKARVAQVNNKEDQDKKEKIASFQALGHAS